ncbi:MAG: S41 family peptidase [Bacteroidales bacterium]|nr:S41 family peptidase [Bacteroidales bacterium]
MKKQPNLLTWFVSMLIVAVVPALGQQINPKSTTQKFASVMQIINFAYVDSVYEPELVEKAIVAMLKELDPHSQYISKENLQKSTEPLEGNFNGVGISFQVYKDTILVIAPVPGGPAERLGIRAGDKIVMIDGENSTGSLIDNNYVFSKLRGEIGTRVDVGVQRKGRSKSIEFTIIRDRIPINSIDASFMATNDIGYIKLNRFSRTSMDEFRKAIGELKDEGMERLILDLRGNSGGYLDVAVDLSDEFLSAGKLVLYTEGTSSPRRKYKSSYRGEFEEGRLVILIDEGSASASEIVAGAVQDWDRGLVVGRRSFGKGLVQRPYYLPDSSVVRLTIARYYTPTGRCIQKPYDKGYDQYYDDLYKRLESGELTGPDHFNFPDSLTYFTPNKRVVYGGGGIMPDVFVPWDSTRYTDFYVDVLSKGLFNDFVLNYLDAERTLLANKYNTYEQFNNTYFVDDDFMDKFFEFAASKNIFPVDNELDLSMELIKMQMKALIARNLFEFKSYFQVITQIDECFLTAIDVLHNELYFAELIPH